MYRITLQRATSYYEFFIIYPVIILTLCSFFPFYMSFEVGERLSYGITLVLCMTTYQRGRGLMSLLWDGSCSCPGNLRRLHRNQSTLADAARRLSTRRLHAEAIGAAVRSIGICLSTAGARTPRDASCNAFAPRAWCRST